MRIQLLNDGTEYRSFGGGGFSKPAKSSGLFWWTILITLLIGVATFCWFFSIMVFAHPEKPFNYRLLTKLEKLKPLRKFTPLSVPQGQFSSARDLLAKYFYLTPEQIEVTNDIIKRAYIKNYEEQPPLYVKGEFTVLGSRPLKASDVFPRGWVVLARAADIEDVDVELVLPEAADPSIAYQPGDSIMLDHRSTFASVIHVQKLPQERVCVTVVPLAYQGFSYGKGQAIRMDVPHQLNMEARWPIATDLRKAATSMANGDAGAPVAGAGQKVANATDHK